MTTRLERLHASRRWRLAAALSRAGLACATNWCYTREVDAYCADADEGRGPGAWG